MFYFGQEQWNWIVAVYLFLGGMGAMVMAVATIVHRVRAFGQDNTRLMIWGNLSGFVMLAVGSAMLFYHLLDHLAVWRVLLGVFTKPDAWIAWGTWSIIFGMIWGLVYTLPHVPTPKFLAWCQLLRFFKWFGTKFAGPMAWGTVFMSVFTAVYTGMLLQSFPAVELWHNPGIPVLFTVSAVSTALATLLIIQYVVVRDNDMALRHRFEVIDTWLIAVEILVVFGFFFYLLNGTENGQVSHNLLWQDPVWLWGFVVLGLIVPFLINLGLVTRKLPSNAAFVVLSAVLVLVGGYILRHYMLLAGIWELPFPKG